MNKRKQSPTEAQQRMAAELQQLLLDLHQQRKQGKQKGLKRQPLKPAQRQLILEKTGGCCHICGQQLDATHFEADHVKAHTMGGSCTPDNFLPACTTCNNYRWHYLPEELQYILKLGVWARTEIERQTQMGQLIAEKFVRKEAIRKSRVRSTSSQ